MSSENVGMNFEYVEDSNNGPLDGVKCMVEATRIDMRTMKKKRPAIAKTKVSLTGSVELGVVSFLDKSNEKMLTVRLDELTVFLREVLSRPHNLCGEVFKEEN